MDLWTQQGKEKVGQRERVALKCIHHHVEQTASGKLPYNTGSLAGYSAMTEKGRMG